MGFFKNIKNCIIFNNFINLKFNIYNGKNFYSLVVTHKMVGFKFGDFVISKKSPIARKKKKKKRKR
jgi:ribosomal protein S19